MALLAGSKSVTVYVAEIKGRGIAAFHADTGSEAERLVRDRALRDDLMVLATGGLPLWDGVTDIEVRLARPDDETFGIRAIVGMEGGDAPAFDLGNINRHNFESYQIEQHMGF